MGDMLPPFQAFMDEHKADVWRFLVASVGSTDAEDCYQETFLAALAAYPKLRHGRNLRSWVLTIANRKAIDVHRGRSKAPRPVERVPDKPARSRDGGDPAVWHAIGSLPDKQRTAVVYRFVQDLAYKDIADAMEITEVAARQNVSEAVKKLREELVR